MTHLICRLRRSRSRLGSLCHPRTAGAVCMILLAGVAGCIPIYRAIQVFEADPHANESAFTTPVRAYLTDGSIVVLPDGGRIEAGQLVSSGWRYALTLEDSVTFNRIATDSVLAVEVFSDRTVNHSGTVIVTAASAVAATIGTSALLVAIFGSCPTIYAEVDGEPVLQMEAFSYSIAPLFEARDVERLGVLPGEDGRLVLELRNEALETHYINQLEVLDVRHAVGAFALPDPSGRPITMSGREPPLSAVDRDGRDVLSELLATDDVSFRSSRERLAAATLEDMTDHVDLVLPVPEGAGQIALGLRMRNTLLNSALFYDIMLAEAGVAGLDWLGSGLDRIGTALEMGRWYQGRMGLRVLVQDGDRYREVVHLPDAGPIGWKEVAVPIPTRGIRELRVRLEFISDSWFIDQAFVASGIERPAVRRVPVSRVVDAEGAADEGAVSALAAADSDYMITFPGQRYQLDFQLDAQSGVQPGDGGAGGAPSDEGRTLLLAAQGYYVEWIRGNWLEGEGEVRPFRPSDDAVLSAMRIWEETMDDFERDFAATRIPVR
jgi:hypothetical protein